MSTQVTVVSDTTTEAGKHRRLVRTQIFGAVIDGRELRLVPAHLHPEATVIGEGQEINGAPHIVVQLPCGMIVVRVTASLVRAGNHFTGRPGPGGAPVYDAGSVSQYREGGVAWQSPEDAWGPKHMGVRRAPKGLMHKLRVFNLDREFFEAFDDAPDRDPEKRARAFTPPLPEAEREARNAEKLARRMQDRHEHLAATDRQNYHSRLADATTRRKKRAKARGTKSRGIVLPKPKRRT